MKKIIFLFIVINIFFIISIEVLAFNDFSFNSAFHKATAGAFRSHSESLIKQSYFFSLAYTDTDNITVNKIILIMCLII
ncbi:hypothetical protein [Brachyspira pulli]|uniref:hypothetical protein n=1 Tax=Brachyspira pulli TaxID=310721 RepID=UPI0030076D45